MPAPIDHRAKLRALRALVTMGAAWAWTDALALPHEDARHLAVIYPDIGEPFRGVFAQILDGIQGQAGRAVAQFALNPATPLPELAAELRRREVRVVIALGRSGLQASASLDRGMTVIAGCVLAVPESVAQEYTVHSLTPDPRLLFGQLGRLLPSARRVFVVHDPRQNAWLIRLARQAAKARSLELSVQEADDLPRATRAYQDILARAEPRSDVLWLPQDTTTVEESTLLPMILQEAWRRGFAVISSNVAHVKRGALFALYPDNPALGRSLATSALAALHAGPQAGRGLQPLRDVLLAVNLRTAQHLGLDLDARRGGFDQVYPES